MVSLFAACQNNDYGSDNDDNKNDNNQSQTESKFDSGNEITVLSREDGSGTRGAFIELFGIEEKDANGNKIDKTTLEADITNSTNVMMTRVAGDIYSIGYISLGSLNKTVKAVKIDGNTASVENIKNNTYKVSRPFNIAVKEGLSEVAQDFIDYIMSAEGQKVIEENGCISISQGEPYGGNMPSGKIVVAGSTSVGPVMEKLKEAYLSVNPNAEIQVQQNDSTTGMTSAIDGVCDIGMASRELKDSEIEKGLKSTAIAMDGIAVIVNNDSPVDNLTSEQVKSIFTGSVTDWKSIVD